MKTGAWARENLITGPFPFAIAILWKDGEKMGYIKKELARYLAPIMHAKGPWTGTITTVHADWLRSQRKGLCGIKAGVGERTSIGHC